MPHVPERSEIVSPPPGNIWLCLGHTLLSPQPGFVESKEQHVASHPPHHPGAHDARSTLQGRAPP
eukprot:2636196-Karenia_brevis.AAC.1